MNVKAESLCRSAIGAGVAAIVGLAAAMRRSERAATTTINLRVTVVDAKSCTPTGGNDGHADEEMRSRESHPAARKLGRPRRKTIARGRRTHLRLVPPPVSQGDSDDIIEPVDDADGEADR